MTIPDNNSTPDLAAEFKTWQANPSPEANAHMLQVLDPTIDKAAGSQVGQLNPLVKAKARAIALQALGSYDPKKGQLSSHIYNHMQGLKRYSGQIAQGLQVPERVTLDHRAMAAAHRELSDELGRDPTDDELSDRTGFSARRLTKLRSVRPAMTQGYFQALGEHSAEGAPFDPAVSGRTGGPSRAWLQVIYDDLGPYDKKVFEHTLGWNNQPTLPNQEIAAKLRRSPGWVSQRKLIIQRAIDQEQELSPFGA